METGFVLIRSLLVTNIKNNSSQLKHLLGHVVWKSMVEIDSRDSTKLSHVCSLALFLCVDLILFSYRRVSYTWQGEEGRGQAADLIHHQIVALKSTTSFVLEIVKHKG